MNMTSYISNANDSQCYGCRACEQICPSKAIHMEANTEGFLYPVLNEALCSHCGLCSKVCPYDDAGVTHISSPLAVYAMQNNDSAILNNSSSGGVFYTFAEFVLNKGGAVAGCIFDDNFRAIHTVTEDIVIVKKMQGSKYVQSDTQNTFLEVKQRLVRGQLVLYTGTPCQIHGLKCFLRKDYKNLFTIDLICHGVPSPLMLDEYLKSFRQRHGEIQSVAFRDKLNNGWCSQGTIQFYEGDRAKKKRISPYNDSFYQMYYIKNVISRMSCYSCIYATCKRVGDISIGDYWNVRDSISIHNLNKGVSVALINTQQGQSLFDIVKESFQYKKTELSTVIAGNGNLSQPVSLPEARKTIYLRLKERGYDAVTQDECRYHYVMPFIRKHIPHYIKILLREILR